MNIKPVVVHILDNPFTNDTRVSKEIRTISENFDIELILIARGNWKLPTEERRESNVLIHRINLKSDLIKIPKLSTLLQIIEWHLRVNFQLNKLKPKLVHAHDIIPFISAIIYRIFTGCLLIYDSHEFQSEIKIAKFWRKHTYRFFEKVGSLLTDVFITVSDPIEKNYKHLFNFKNPNIIMNCPPLYEGEKNNYFREKFSLHQSDVIYLYQGAFVKGRGIEIVLDTFESLSGSQNHIVFMGFGPLEKLIKEKAELFSQIHIHEAVTSDELLKYTASADVGITLTDYSCKNHLFSMPNKFFEYIQASIPIICTNLVKVREIIDRHQIGIVVEEITATNLKSAIQMMGPKHLLLKSNIKSLKNKFIWENEEKKLIRIYASLLQT
jgi:glycosyltransferase involved in cell wall biosynthesis